MASASDAAEGVARLRVAALEAGEEPLLALFGGAVGPGLRVHLATRLLLDPVVAHRRRGLQRFLDLRLTDRVDQPAGSRRRLGPDAGVAVGLQLALPGSRCCWRRTCCSVPVMV